MNKISKILIIIGGSLVVISLILVSINIYNNYRASSISLKNYEIIKSIKTSNDTENKNIVNNTINIDGDEYIGVIDIPSLNLKLPVASTWDYEKMKKSPCRYSGSIEDFDLVISAHSYKSQFGLIKNLKQGDKLIFTDISLKEYIFEVKVIEILSPFDVEEMIDSEFDLTLYTCTKDSKNRVTVRLNRVDEFSEISI